MSEVPDLFKLTPEERARLQAKKTLVRRDYVPMQLAEEESVDSSTLDALEKEALELLIEHLKKLRFR